MSEIFPGLWICNLHDVRSPLFLKATKATHILNCAQEVLDNPIASNLGICVKNIPMFDDEDSSSFQHITDAAQLIDTYYTTSNILLVHCLAGVSRSPTVVMAWLILYRGYSYDKAYELVVKKRNFIRPNPFFTLILKSLEKK